MLTRFAGRVILLVIVGIFLLVIKVIVSAAPTVLVLDPVLLPVIRDVKVGPVRFNIIVVMGLTVKFIAPPVKMGLFITDSLASIPIVQVTGGTTPVVKCFLLTLLLLAFVPMVDLYLL